MNFYPIYKNKKLLPWIKWWILKGNKVTPKHLSEWIDSAEAITLTGVYKGSPLLYLNLKGNTSQTGTPSPEAPVPVNVVKEDNYININDDTFRIDLGGKNLWNPTPNTNELNGVTITTNNDGTITLNGTATAQTVFTFPTVELEQGIYYGLSITKISGTTSGQTDFDIYRTGNLKIRINAHTDTLYLRNNTFENGTWNTRVLVLNGVKLDNFTVGVMLEKNEVQTTFSPYVANPIELCKIGTYQDVIYKENNKYYVEKKIGKVTFNSNSSIGAASSSTDGYARAGWGKSSDNIKFVGNDKIGVLCDKFLGKPQNDNTTSVTGSHWYCSNSNVNDYMIMFRCGDSEISSSNFITYLKNNVSFYHVLATSTTTEITETTLLSQLEAIYNAKLQSGTNEITQTPSDLPFYLNFRYYEKG